MEDYADSKRDALGQNGTLNAHPEHVTDDLFSESEFFDPRDLLQVKYEMLRRVRQDGLPVSKAAKIFGFSRVSYYQIQHAYDQQGLAGLMPRQRGPRHAHKLTEEVMAFISTCKSKEASLHASELAIRIKQHFGLSVHRRSIERALQRQLKKGL
ncbi:transposase [Planctomycetota bacterium]